MNKLIDGKDMKNQNDFIIQVTLIDPIEKIIYGLEKDDYRDCDFNWLNKKLVKFTQFAAETLGKDISLPSVVIDGKMNDYNKNRFIDGFKILRDYFKSL